MPILDHSAESLLKNNTRRKEGISDIPKDYGEALKAAPGYGLPHIRKFKKPLNDESLALETISPSGGLKHMPVASIAKKNIA